MHNLVFEQFGRRCFPALLCACILSCAAWAAEPTMPEKYYRAEPSAKENSSEQLFSPTAGQEFYQIAHQIAGTVNTGNISYQQANQAIILLNATASLDPRSNYALTDLINLASKFPQQDYSQLLLTAVDSYIDESADVDVVRNAFSYLLERLNSREEREKLLTEKLKKFTGKNSAVESELAVMLGLLAAEKADANNAIMYFTQAYNTNKYNRLAFSKLVELSPKQIAPATWLEHLRLLVSENPMDMQSALAFAQQAERFGLYDIAADAYQYCTDMFNYQQPSAKLPAQIYLPLAINSYNSTLNRNKCTQLARRLRQNGQFDLLLEAIAAKAAEKNGDTQQADDILRDAQAKALEAVKSQSAPAQAGDYEKLAWFYCFAVHDANNALNWANKAYSAEPNSPMASALLAYALTLTGQNDWAKSIIDNSRLNQISAMAQAQIQLAKGQQEQAIESLKSAIAMDPAAIEAETAKKILTEKGGTYVPPADPDILLSALKTSLNESLTLQFIPPEKIISVQLNVKGNKFAYGSDFGGSVTITNNSAGPLVISENALFAGNIRIDADITGDIKEKLTNVVALHIHPPAPIVQGRSTFIPVSLDGGTLKEILLGHPQASLKIEFTTYIDPITAPDGSTINRLASIPPAKLSVTRPGTEVSTKYLQNRLNSLAKGQQGQKIKTVELFTGLLVEQQDLAAGKISYQMVSADWMPQLLTSALVHNLADSDWVIRVHAMAEILPVSLNYELTNSVSENLNDTRWPCRLMAEYLLANRNADNFKKVLDWTAKHDPNKLVRDMAVALGGEQPKEEKIEQPEKSEPKPPAQTTGRISEPNKPPVKK